MHGNDKQISHVNLLLYGISHCTVAVTTILLILLLTLVHLNFGMAFNFVNFVNSVNMSIPDLFSKVTAVW